VSGIMSNDTKDEISRAYMLKEVELIEDIIKRMGSNSFLVKGWTITLVVASLLLKGPRYQAWIAFIPLLMFWFLDAYFLWQEKMYRELFAWVVTNRLKTTDHLFDLNANRFKHVVQSKYRVMLSTTMLWFYGSIALLTVIYQAVLLVIGLGLCW
jgi:hypothetical protein